MEKEVRQSYPLQLIEWELTGSTGSEPLTSIEIHKTFDNIAQFSRPVICFTGKEVLAQPDLFTITKDAAAHAFEIILDPETNDIPFSAIRDISGNGIQSIMIRLDGATAEKHDEIHGIGDFDMAQATIEFSRQVNLPFSVTTTITRNNVQDLPFILDFAIRINATAFHPYILIPKKKLDAKFCLSAKEYEETLIWISQQRRLVPSWFGYKPTCAPQYYRVVRQNEDGDEEPNPESPEHGCTGGRSFAYISAGGLVQTCGELAITAGSLRTSNFDFRSIWEQSKLFRTIRNPDTANGRCRQCEYRNICGGCRARAYIATGDYLAAEPLCAYEPGTYTKKKGRTHTPAENEQ